MLLAAPGVYIGDVSDLRDLQGLAAAGVTHILTVDAEEPAIPKGSEFKRKFVMVMDDSSSDLLSHLDDCLAFIHAAVGAGPGAEPGAVLVHCHAGQSRSAVVVTAYLMQQSQRGVQGGVRGGLDQAYSLLKQIKPDVRVNEGFWEQLCVYESLGCQLDVSSPQYRQYRLTKLSENYTELQNVPKEVFAADPAHNTDPAPCSEVVYRCRKCRRTLFHGSSLLSHPLGNGPTSFGHQKLSNLATGDHAQCTSYFTEPVQWMEEALLGVMDGQLLCPKCRSKLGSFNWSGDRCSCGHWVTPAFQMHKSKTDEMRKVNVSTAK